MNVGGRRLNIDVGVIWLLKPILIGMLALV